jgi:ketosteroid isomerase-like protein
MIDEAGNGTSIPARQEMQGHPAMRQIFALTILFAFWVTAAVGQSVNTVTKDPQESADEKILLQMERDWNQALQVRDVKWFEQNLAGDMTDIVSSDGALYTKEQNIAALKSDKTTYISLELSGLNVRVEGNAGVVTGVNVIKARDANGKPAEMKFAFTDVYIKREGRWQVWASQHTRIAP